MNTVAQGKKSTEEYQYRVCKIIGIKWGEQTNERLMSMESLSADGIK